MSLTLLAVTVFVLSTAIVSQLYINSVQKDLKNKQETLFNLLERQKELERKVTWN